METSSTWVSIKYEAINKLVNRIYELTDAGLSLADQQVRECILAIRFLGVSDHG